MFRKYNKNEKWEFLIKFLALEVCLPKQKSECLLSMEIKRGKQERFETSSSHRIKYEGGVTVTKASMKSN